MLIVNKTREAAACAQANCASSFTNATNAATSATNAANSATEAAASAAAAATSETNTENLWEQFNALYLGAFAVAPTTDNEGNPLQEGALYWNSVSNTMFAWDGSAWATATNFNEFTNFTATGTTTARNLVTRFADVVNVKDFGAVGDGVTDDTNAFQAILNISSSTNNISCFIPKGTYLLNSTPTEGSTKVTWIFDRNATLVGPGKYAPFVPQTPQLDGTPISANIPKISLIEGTPTNPLTNLTYKTPSLYLERHTNSNMPDSSLWGNLRKISPITVECYAYANDTSEVNCFAGKAVSYEPVNPAYPNQLVGISSLAESRVTSGKSRDMWAANFVASSGGPDSTRPTNICGIETDVIQDFTMPVIPPGYGGSCNATAYWAQGSGSQTSNSAFYISTTNSVGWLYGLYTFAPFQEYVAFFGNGLNAPNAKGVRINTQWGADTGRILECFAGGGERFRVDGSSGAGNQSPVWLALNGTMKRIDVGAADSGGVGYRMLRVLN